MPTTNLTPTAPAPDFDAVPGPSPSPSAPAPPALPSGWKPVSTQSDKGYKFSTNSHTAYVKPAPGGGHHLLVMDGNGLDGDVDLHPHVLGSVHEAFALAHAKLGRLVPPQASPAGWDGGGPPPGYAPVAGASYLHKKAAGGKTAFVGKMKAAPGGAPSYSASGYGPGGEELSPQVHATPQAAHAAAEAYLKVGAPKTDALKTGPPSPAPLPAAPPPAPAVPPPVTPPPPLPAPTPLMPPPASGPQHVSFGGTKVAYKNGPVTEADVDALHGKVAPGFSNSALPKMKALVASGAIKDLDHLHQIAALAKAVPSPHAHISSAAVDKAMAYGGVTALKDKAEAGDADAQAVAGGLGPTSHLSTQERQTKAFQGQSAAQLTHQQTGPQAGSNPGGFFTTAAGEKVYVKKPADPQQAHSEHAANAIYRALGVGAPLSAVAPQGGQAVYASKLIPNAGTLGKGPLTKALAREALKGHAADILLANHDVTGQGLDNMVAGHDGGVSRIDNGGSLLYRAQGAKKTDGELKHLGAWDGFSDPSKNADYAKLFQAAGYQDASKLPGMAAQISAIQRLQAEHGGWDNFLKAHAPGMDDAARQKTAAVLTRRTALLGKKRLELLETQGGSLEALAGKTSVEGGEARESGKWGNTPFAQYAQKVDALPEGSATKKHFGALYAGHPHVWDDLTGPISKWTGSSSGHAWQDQWPAALAKKTHIGAQKVAEAYETRRQRWQAISDQHGVPFPETFHLHRGVSDHDGTMLPHIISAWQNEDEPYMAVKAHPASSWSLSRQSAKSFYGGHNGAMFETHVPFEQTLADKYADDQSFLHSYGAENEVVVGGKKDGIIAPKSGVTAKYKGVEYRYDDRQKLFDEWKKDHGGKLPDPKAFGIDIAAGQKKAGQKVQLAEGERGMAEEASGAGEGSEGGNAPGGDGPSEYIKRANARIKAFQAPLLRAGVTPAPPDGAVKPLGSFAQARAEMAEKGDGQGPSA